MRKNVTIPASLILAFILLTACAQSAGKEDHAQTGGKVVFEQAAAIDARPFLSENDLLRAVKEGAWPAQDFDAAAAPNFCAAEEAQKQGIKALVVPHHAAAAALAAQAVSRLAENPPPVIIILAPNHYNEGPAAASATMDFLSYGRRVSADETAIGRLVSSGLVSASDKLFEREHSVGELIPIISWYLPETKIIPIIFYHDYDPEKILEIIKALKPETDAGAVIIASIDFSHYLTMDEAEKKDATMREYLENGDWETISKLDSSFVDSPAILAAMLLHFGTGDMEIIANTNSGVLMKNPVMPCTSYFTIEWL